MAVFSEDEVAQLAIPFQHTLVGKFSFGRPPLASIRQHLLNLDCSSVRIQFLNQRHVLIFLNNADEFAKLWLRREVFIDSLPMRLFKWSPSFNVKHEPSVAPVWIRISGLPIHLFDKRALFTIGGLIGEPIKIDEATCKLSRIEFARICIEIDVRQQPPAEICVMNAGELICVPVVYERLPKYCSHCHHLGHEVNACYIKQAGPRPRRNLRNQPDIKSKGKEKVTELQPNESTAGPSEIRTEAPCPTAAFGVMAEADSSIDAAAHVANMDAAAAAAVSHAAHAPNHVPQDVDAAAAVHAAVHALDDDPHAAHAFQDGTAQAVPLAAEDASTSAAPCPPAGHDQFLVSYVARPATAPPSLSVKKNKKKKKKHKNEENDESSKNEKKKEKKKKRGKKHKDVLILPDLLPDENESAVLRAEYWAPGDG